MAKILFPYIDRRQFPFLAKTAIRFPFVVEDLVYYWTFEADGVVLYLHNDNIPSHTPVFADIMSSGKGITMYLQNADLPSNASIYNSIYITFEQIGKGINTLGILDPMKLGDIDSFTLGEISRASANWSALRNSIASTLMDSILYEGNGARIALDSDCTLVADRTVFTGQLSSFIAHSDLHKHHINTLGDLDPYILEDIDMMLSTFEIFEHIPAYLTKGIIITDRNALKLSFEESGLLARISSNASGIISSMLGDLGKGGFVSNVHAYASDVNMQIHIDEIMANGNVDAKVYISIESFTALSNETMHSGICAKKTVYPLVVSATFVNNTEINGISADKIIKPADKSSDIVLNSDAEIVSVVSISATEHKITLLSSGIATETSTTETV